MKHFPDEQSALDYVMPELIATLEGDLGRMCDKREGHLYTDEDREEMRNRIADLRAIESRVTLAPAY